MSHEARFTLPLPPSINKSYATVQGRRVASRALRMYKKDAHYILYAQGAMSPLWSQAKMLGYEVTFYVPTRASDIDNRNKAALDAVSAALGFNDNRIYEAHHYKRIDRNVPRTEMRLYILE